MTTPQNISQPLRLANDFVVASAVAGRREPDALSKGEREHLQGSPPPLLGASGSDAGGLAGIYRVASSACVAQAVVEIRCA